MRRTIGILLVLALAIGGFATWRYDLVDRWLDRDQPSPGADPDTVAPPEGLELPPVTVPSPVADVLLPGALDAPAVRKALTPYLGDPDLGPHVLAAVAPLDPAEGRPVLIGSGTAVPASTTKVVTSAAALLALGPDHTFETTVVRAGKGTIVLVGGGDPFLARGPVAADEEAPYPVRADVADLAARTAANLRERGVRRVTLGYDASLFTGPSASPQWEPDYVPDGVVSPITALWVDEGRPDTGFGRVADPALDAAQTFAAALAENGITVTAAPTPATAAAGSPTIARVTSAPLAQIVERVLQTSDNEASEVLLRHVGLQAVDDASFAGGRRGVTQVLGEAGVDLTADTLYDGSGLSRRNRLTPRTLLAVLQLASSRPRLGAVLSGLPVSAFNGSLADRFSEVPAPARGRVRAKTGTLTGVSSLAGFTTDATGHPMLFVLMADRVAKPDETDAEVALDLAAAALAICRCGAAA